MPNQIGDPEAIRDWWNASFYNKDEIDNYFIQNNKSGVIPYDLTFKGSVPDQYIKLVGQTSGQTYNICLASILGDTYVKQDLFWFSQGEDIKIFDPDTGTELLGYALGDRKDEIELPGDYITESVYYMEEAGTTVTNLNGRIFTKSNDGPSYGYGYWDGTYSTPVLLSMDQNAVQLSWHYVTHSFTYDGKTWYAGGNGYGFDADCASVNRLDISSYAPFSTDPTDTYKLPTIQKAIAALNIIYHKNIPIPQSV